MSPHAGQVEIVVARFLNMAFLHYDLSVASSYQTGTSGEEMQGFKRWITGFVMAVSLSGGVSAPALGEADVIAVNHRLPGELASLIRPLLEPGEVVMEVPSGLLVKASPARIEEIRSLVEKLDRRLRQLTITVLQSSELTLDELNAEANVIVRIPSAQPIQGQAHLYRSYSDRDQGSRQSLKTLEGQPAYIFIGQERPVPVIGVYGYPPVVVGGIDYQPVTTGFKVVPRMAGCSVRLTISPWSQRMGRMGEGSIDVQAAGTTVEVKLGRWVELGALSDDLDETRDKWLGYSATTERRRSRVFIKVDSPEGCQP